MALSTEANDAAARVLTSFISTCIRLQMTPHERVIRVGHEEANGEPCWLGYDFPYADMEIIYANLRESGLKQQATRDGEPGFQLRAVTMTPRDLEQDLWIIQPAYHGVGPCGLTTIQLPSRPWGTRNNHDDNT